jgi:hypothetical protein
MVSITTSLEVKNENLHESTLRIFFTQLAKSTSLLHKQITNLMEQSSSTETNSRSAGQSITRLL